MSPLECIRGMYQLARCLGCILATRDGENQRFGCYDAWEPFESFIKGFMLCKAERPQIGELNLVFI